MQAGSQPRLLGERLTAMVPPAARGAGGKDGKTAKATADDQQLAA